ncbi:Hypothetical protein A7982_07789 [Minicystis rosea]|nr:Hypothetical protein A7982_07789 [Minicystis rosea]
MSTPGPLRRYLREPLVHFAVIGGALFALHAAVAPPPRDAAIVVSADFIAGLREEHRARTGQWPTAEEERALVDRFIDEEVLYREAVSLGLDRGDPIVRRRLAQKMVFVAEDGAAAREPSDADLQAYLVQHQGRYREPARLSFRHVFLSRDRRADAAAEATRILPELAAGAAPEGKGDPFLQGTSFGQRTSAEVEAVFGHAFAEALFAAPNDAWSGPLTSSFGVHLVRAGERTEGAIPPLAKIRARVRSDLMDERRATAGQALRERLRARYRIDIERPKARVASAPEKAR